MPSIPFLFITISLLFSTAAATVNGQELDAALLALRSRGYTLFSNAITTSDIRLLLLSLNSTFTLFSPPDPLIYSLDLSSTAPLYVRALLLHVSPIRLSSSDLKSIRGSPYLDTLVPPHRIFIDRSLVLQNDSVFETVLVDGVPMSVPDLFLGSAIAVHGLEGILVSGFGSDTQEERVDQGRPSDPPFLSPVSWPEANAPASSPTEAGTAFRPRKRNGRRGQRKGNQQGFVADDVSNDGGDVGHGKFTKYSRQFGV